MELKDSIESIRDLTVDIIHAGKVACAQVIEKIDSKIAGAINSPDDD